MSVARAVDGWREVVASSWAGFVGRLPSVVARAQGGPARHAVRFLSGNVLPAVFVIPDEAAKALEEIRPLVDRAIAELDDEYGRSRTIPFSVLDVMNLANALDCIGLRVSDSTTSILRKWLPSINVSPNDDDRTGFWSRAFCGLALDIPGVIQQASGRDLGTRLFFQGGQVFQFNVQGLLRYLSAATESKARFDQIQPAWEDYLENYARISTTLSSSDEGTLLWIARVVFHRIGGNPLGSVARYLHESAFALVE